MHRYFPIAQKDELLSSILSRFVHVQGITYHKKALEILFGNRKITCSPLFQGHIDELLENVGSIWCIDRNKIIQEHTCLPLFKPFTSKETYDYIVSHSFSGNAAKISAKIGKLGSSISWPIYYKICPICSNEQLDNLGFLYWQRLFQCLGVEACPHHHCLLYETKIKLTSDHKFQFSNPIMYKNKILPVYKADSNLVKLAELTLQLLELESPSIRFLQWTNYYRQLAYEKGYANSHGILYSELISQIRLFWGEKQLTQWGLINPEIDGVNNMYWLKNLFLDHNRACLYQKHFIVLLALNNEIIDLSSLVNKVKHLPDYKKPPSKLKSVTATTRNKRRKSWLGYINQYSDKPVQFFKTNLETRNLYIALTRTDNEWYQQHKPKIRKKVKNCSRLNWNKRDKSLVKKLIVIYGNHCESLSGPRLSKSWYCSHFKEKYFYRLDNLPLCKLFFQKYTESTEQYQIRRLTYKLINLIQSGKQNKSILEIARKAGLSEGSIKPYTKVILEYEVPFWRKI